MNNRGTWQNLPINIMGVSAGLAIIAVGYLFGLHPLMQAWVRSHALSVKVDQSMEVATHAGRKVADLQRQILEVEHSIKQSEIRLQPVQQYNRRLGEISQLASALNLQIDAMTTTETLARSHFSMVPMRLAGSGSFQQFTAFIHAIREKFPDMGIAAFRVSDNASRGAGPSAFEVDLTWYAAPTLTSAQLRE